jgi:hypothetical protein
MSDDPTTITPVLLRELAEADYGRHLAVLSRSEQGTYRVEPHVNAQDAGREIVTDASAVEAWSDGQEMTDSDYEQLAAELAGAAEQS